MDIGQVIGFGQLIVGALVAAIGSLAGAIVVLYKTNEKKNREQVALVKTVTEALTVSSSSLAANAAALASSASANREVAESQRELAAAIDRQTAANTVEHKQQAELFKASRRAVREAATRRRMAQ